MGPAPFVSFVQSINPNEWNSSGLGDWRRKPSAAIIRCFENGTSRPLDVRAVYHDPRIGVLSRAEANRGGGSEEAAFADRPEFWFMTGFEIFFPRFFPFSSYASLVLDRPLLPRLQALT